MKRILCSLFLAILPFGSVLAAAPTSKNAKVTLAGQCGAHRRESPRRSLSAPTECRSLSRN